MTERLEDNIKIKLTEMGCGVGRWIELAQHRSQWLASVLEVLSLRAIQRLH